jgi:hypothetical protein
MNRAFGPPRFRYAEPVRLTERSGVWSEKEAKDFEAEVSDMGKVDSEDWQ